MQVYAVFGHTMLSDIQTIIFLKGGGHFMRVTPFVSGIATGAVAGAVVSMVAAGAMMNPSVRRSAQHAANKAEHAMHKAARNVGNMIG